MGFLSQFAVGYDGIEPVVVSNVAVERNFILIGKHGTCKTTLARSLANGYGGSFVVYDATKDDIISICGIPKTKALEEGRFEFATGDRTIWEKKLIVIDEIGRATKENQNILLEILQEKTCFGIPLQYRTLIATMNPESYAASLRLDEALLDRFHCVINVPDFHRKPPSKVNIQKIISMNLQGRNVPATEDIRDLYSRIKNSHEYLRSESLVFQSVTEYVSSLLEIFIGKTEKYISPRRYNMLADEILIIGAYLLEMGEVDFLKKAARKALDYTLTNPLRLDEKDRGEILSLHRNFEGILVQSSDRKSLLRAEIARRSNSDRIIYIVENLKNISETLQVDESIRLMGEVLEWGKDKEPLILKTLYEKLNGFQCPDEIRRNAIAFYRTALEEGCDIFIKKLKGFSITSVEHKNCFVKLNEIIKDFKKDDILNTQDQGIERFKTILLETERRFLKIQSLRELFDLVTG